MRGRRPALFAAALGAALLAAHAASAFCRSTTCEDGTQCSPPSPADCGEPIAWRRACVGVSVQGDGSKQIPASEARATLLEAFAAWEAADCGDGTTPSIRAADLGFVSCDEVEYSSSAGNANILLFRDSGWPHAAGPHDLALTTVTFDTQTGEIYDADIELNTAGYAFTLGEAAGDYDLLSVLTHETGHFLGLAHSSELGATMTSIYSAGDLGFRTLSLDDEAAVCAVYPPKPTDEPCDPIPRHGFSPRCSGEQTEGQCSAPPPGEPARSPGAGSMLAALAMLATRRARRRGGTPWRLRARSAHRPS